jgi:hypothetical protein
VIVSEQLVCWTKTWATPHATPDSRTAAATASVMSRVPRPAVEK